MPNCLAGFMTFDKTARRDSNSAFAFTRRTAAIAPPLDAEGNEIELEEEEYE